MASGPAPGLAPDQPEREGQAQAPVQQPIVSEPAVEQPPAPQPEAAPKPPFRQRLRARWQGAKNQGARAKNAVCGFCALAWPGMVLGALAVAIAYGAWMVHDARTGIGPLLDVLAGGVFSVVATALVGLAVILLAMLLRKCFTAWPRLFIGGFFSALLSLPVVFGLFGAPPPMILRLTVPPILIGATLGTGLTMLLRRKAGIKKAHKYVAAGVTVLGLAAAIALGWWLHWPGSDPYIELQPPVASIGVSQLTAPNPGVSGPFKIHSLYYGSGNNKRRPEFGASVALKTKPVDVRKLFKGLEGFKAKVRQWYWGFGPKEFPLNARVWYPEGSGPYPLVLIVHGNHNMAEYSDPGYQYLGELLASRGFITASVDENFINGSWIGGYWGENGVRGWLLLKHLEAWRDWNRAPGNPFYGKVDMQNIALVGHSRGGEAVAHAAAFNHLTRFPDDGTVAFDFNFAIKALVAIAPIDGQYEPANEPAPIENVNYLVLQGSHDADVSFYAGYRPFRRVKFTDGNYYMKAGIFTYRANHGQFNTVWGSFDTGNPVNMILNQQPVLLAGEEQRQVARVYIAGFLEATLHGKKEYVPMFRDHRTVANWLPKTVFLNQFEDSNYRTVTDFEKTIDITKASIPGGQQTGENLTVWRHKDLKSRGDWNFKKKGLLLGWESEEPKGEAKDKKPAEPPKVASYAITLPEGLASDWKLTENASLVLSIADTDEDPHPKDLDGDAAKAADKKKAQNKDQAAKDAKDKDKDKKDKSKEKKEPVDFTVELVAADGATARLPLSAVSAIQPILKIRWTKWDYLENEWYKKPGEPVFQTFEIPLSLFSKAEPKFQPASLKAIRLRFDRTKKDVIAIDSIGFALR